MSDLLHDHQREAVKMLTEGFDSPTDKVIYFMPPGFGKSEVMEHLRKQYTDAKTNGLVATHTVWEESAPITAEQLEEWWEKMKEQPDAVILIDGASMVVDMKRQLLREVVENRVRSFLPEMIERSMTQLYPEKPWINMNDWRNNRGGRRNR